MAGYHAWLQCFYLFLASGLHDKIVATLIYGKTCKNIPLQHRWSRFPRNLACSIGDSGPLKFAQMVTRLTLTYFAAVNLHYISVFSRDKSKSSDFFSNYCSMFHESWHMQTTNLANDRVLSIEGYDHFLTLTWGSLIWKLKRVFLRNIWTILKIYQHNAGQMTKIAGTPFYGKTFKLFFSSTGGLISTKLNM